MLDLTESGNSEIAVNPDHVVTARSAKPSGGTELKMINGDTVTVVEPFSKVKVQINACRE